MSAIVSIPSRPTVRHSAPPVGSSLVKSERGKPALYEGRDYWNKQHPLSKSADIEEEVKETLEYLKTEQGEQEHKETCTRILAGLTQRARRSAKQTSEEPFAPPPAQEPIIVRRTTVPPEGLFLEEATDKVGFIYRANMLKALNIASVPLRVMRRPGGAGGNEQAEPDTESVAARHLLRLIARPNSHMSGTDLIEAISVWMNTRQALVWMYFEKGEQTTPQEAQGKVPVALYIIPSNRAIGMLSGGSLLYYRLTGSQGISVPAWQVIRVGFYNVKEELRCLSPLSATFQTADTSYSIELWNSQFFENGARPSAMISFKGEISDEKAARIKERIQALSGLGNAHGIMWQDDDAKVQPLTTSQKDMDFKALTESNKNIIATAQGIPLSMFGEMEHGGKVSSQVMRTSFWQDTLQPEARKIEDKLNVHLVPFFAAMYKDQDIFVEFDWSRVEALADDRTEFATAFSNTANGIAQLMNPAVNVMTGEDAADLLKQRFDVEVEGELPDDPYEDEEEIMAEGLNNPLVRGMKSTTFAWLGFSDDFRSRKSLKAMLINYLLRAKMVRRPTAEVAERLAETVCVAVKKYDGDKAKLADYFISLDKKVAERIKK